VNRPDRGACQQGVLPASANRQDALRWWICIGKVG